MEDQAEHNPEKVSVFYSNILACKQHANPTSAETLQAAIKMSCDQVYNGSKEPVL